jgi:very-short-patch-repair endonuclease
MKPALRVCAQRNGGPFRRVEALSAGYTGEELQALLRNGLWVALRRGVYIDAVEVHMARDPARRHALDVSAARLVVAHAVGSHGSAAVVHGLPDWLLRRGTVVLTRPGRSRTALPVGTGPAVVVHGGHRVGREPVVRHGAVVTDVTSTIVDIARDDGLLPGCVAAEAAMHDNLVDRATLDAALASLREHGEEADVLRRVVDISGHQAESVLETISWVRFHEHGLPLPERQRWLRDRAGTIGRVDFWWDEQRVVGEADGLAKYRDDPESLVAERSRQARLEAAGFTVVRWTWRDMMDRPAESVARIARALRRAA